MLTHLSIRDFVLVSNIALEFSKGLNVITGESGAGKSIIINALSLLLGERGSPTLVREGAVKSEISAVFELSSLKDAKNWLESRDLLRDNECIIRRIIGAEGGTKSFINTSPVTLEDLREFGSFMVSVQGQSFQQNLMNRKNHVAFIDDYGDLSKDVAAYTKAYDELLKLKKDLHELRELGRADSRTMDLIKHELEELTKISVPAEKFAELEEEHNRLNNAGEIIESVSKALAILQGSYGGASEDLSPDGSASASADISSQLSNLSSILSAAKDKTLNRLNDNLSQIEILLKDTESELTSFSQMMDADPSRLDALNQQMSDIYTLARKHNVSPDSLTEVLKQREEEWDKLSKLDERVQSKETEIKNHQETCESLASALTTKRKAVVEKFNKSVTKEMSKLEMSCRFATKFSYREELSRVGDSDVEFLFASSPAAKLLPLKNIASGGEMSRAALAITKIVAQNSSVPCLIFDEVDSGIGGKVAFRVGQSMAELGKQAQVISITHQPQTAVHGAHHYAVERSDLVMNGHDTAGELNGAGNDLALNGKAGDKSENEAGDSQNISNISNIRLLDTEARQQEIARMIGGEKIEQDALSYASKLMEQARLNVP